MRWSVRHNTAIPTSEYQVFDELLACGGWPGVVASFSFCDSPSCVVCHMSEDGNHQMLWFVSKDENLLVAGGASSTTATTEKPACHKLNIGSTPGLPACEFMWK